MKRFAESVSCHAWNAKGDQVALCPNNNEIHIYQKQGNDWKVVHKLVEHTQIVTGLDWGKNQNRILSCSQDRNAYVWNFVNGKWKPTLVILRLNRAATDVAWSPDEKKFAVATGAKVASICYFEEDNDWWVSKHVKKHKSTVLSVKWHPNNVIIATASSDYRCRVFSAYTKGVDKGDVVAPAGLPQDKKSLRKFGSLLAEYNCNGWVKDCAFSPSGNLLAFVGHDSSLTVADLTQKDKFETLKLKTLPFSKVLFTAEDTIVAVGYNCEPYVFKNSGGWKKVKSLDDKKGGSAKKASVANMWRNMDKKGTKAGAKKLNTKHQNTITCIKEFQKGKLTTSGLDGNVVWWNV